MVMENSKKVKICISLWEFSRRPFMLTKVLTKHPGETNAGETPGSETSLKVKLKKEKGTQLHERYYHV